MQQPNMPLSQLIEPYAPCNSDGNLDCELDCQINAITLDSREVTPGACFIAVPGAQTDGRQYIAQAIERGAAVVLAQSEDFDFDQWPNQVIAIDDLSKKVSVIAARFFAHPSKSCRVIGVTGTNAKTSVCYLLAQALQNLGTSSAMIGTIGAGVIGELQDASLTTPDAISVQRQLRALVDAGIEVVCMEVSSHGLDQHRVAAVEYEIAVLTNLSQDHLDYHGTMAAYAEAKAALFRFASLKAAVINSDDDFGQTLLSQLQIKTLSYGADSGDLRYNNLRLNPAGLDFDAHFGDKVQAFDSNLVGAINALNICAVVGVLLCMDYSMQEIAAVIKGCKAPPGRLEKIVASSGDITSGDVSPNVVVDYAHTPDALEQSLRTLRAHCDGQLIVVLGCGGDRDKSKRPLMGAIAQQHADKVILTDDNPRSEQPSAIIADILTAMDLPVSVCHARAQAINWAVQQAKASDWVLIAGKGHETQQVYATQTLAMNDREIAQSALSQWQELAA